MGNCFPPYTTLDRASTSTTVIAIDGSLKKCTVPVTVSSVLGSRNSSSFLCSSDELHFDKSIPALGSEVSLQAGEVYFELPIEKLNCPFSNSEMGALIAKASAAINGGLEKFGGRWIKSRPACFCYMEVD